MPVIIEALRQEENVVTLGEFYVKVRNLGPIPDIKKVHPPGQRIYTAKTIPYSPV